MININNLSVEFSARPLFSNIGFVINRNDRIALTGKNGAGKSTLLKILAGLQQPTSGSVSVPNGVSVGYLPQQMEVADDTTLFEETAKAFADKVSYEDMLADTLAEIERRDDYESTEYAQLLERMDYLNQRMAMEASENVEAEIEKTLVGLGFSRNDFSRPTSEFSGGWRMRIELAKILLRRPDVLLLDEPTNHLDIESIQWLEQFLLSKARAVVLVSHDRAFLDNVTTRTIEITCGRIFDYKVKYSDFVVLRKERVEQQTRAYENQQKMIAETRDFIERFRYKPSKAVQVQSRIKQLEKIVPIEVDEVDNSHLRLKFPPAPRSGDYPVIAEDVAKSYGAHTVFSNVTFTLKRGDKVAFVGKNGEGKSTLVKCIMDQIPYDGELRKGFNVKIGYFAQNQAQLLDGELTVFDTIDNVATGDMRTKVRDILGAFMFGGEASDKKVKVLSGGEKTRLAMIKLLLEPVNFLILDEPTNHLDMRTKDILKGAIKDFDGTVIVVSHDREFLDGLVDKVYEFGGGKVVENLGGIYDFLRKKNLGALSELELSTSPTANEDKEKVAEDSESQSCEPTAKESYAMQKAREKEVKKAEKAVREAEERISKLESEQKDVEDALSKGDSSAETLDRYAGITEKLENAMAEWEEAQTALENILKTNNIG